MDRILTTSPLLAKVARGTYLSTGRQGAAAVEGDFFEDASDHSQRRQDTVAVSGKNADPNPHDIPESGVPTPGADISVRTGVYLSTVRHGAAAVEDDFFEDASDHSQRRQDTVAVSGKNAGLNPHDIPESGVPAPGVDISTRVEAGRSISPVHAAQFVEEEIKAERQLGDDQVKGLERSEGMRKPVTEKQGKDVVSPSQFTGEKESGINVPAPIDTESETAEGEISVRGSRPREARGGASTENRLQALQAGDFHTEHEKRREKSVLQALFPAQSPEPENERRLSIVTAREKDTQILRREDEEDKYGEHIDTGALLTRKNLNASLSPEETKGPPEDHSRKEDHTDTVMPTNPGGPEKPAQRTRKIPPDPPFSREDVFKSPAGKVGLSEVVIKRPVLKSDFFFPPREASAQEMPVRREGRVKIGKINILVKGREKIENEMAWPQAPAYADHMITEDWEWACRYNR